LTPVATFDAYTYTKESTVAVSTPSIEESHRIDTSDLDLPPRLLLGPGPSNAHPRVLQALSTPQVGHLDPAFVELMSEVQ
jgi:alanine-glyoxylate transaminase/serine-glyoxylate transaminase/serine-pyruvate transaminase